MAYSERCPMCGGKGWVRFTLDTPDNRRVSYPVSCLCQRPETPGTPAERQRRWLLKQARLQLSHAGGGDGDE